MAFDVFYAMSSCCSYLFDCCSYLLVSYQIECSLVESNVDGHSSETLYPLFARLVVRAALPISNASFVVTVCQDPWRSLFETLMQKLFMSSSRAAM